jgi:hypothetical protein
MMVVAVRCGSIDPSASNHSLMIKLTIHLCMSSIQGVFVGLLVPWTREEDFERCGRTNFCGICPMDLVPLDIMVSVEAFGKVWC